MIVNNYNKIKKIRVYGISCTGVRPQADAIKKFRHEWPLAQNYFIVAAIPIKGVAPRPGPVYRQLWPIADYKYFIPLPAC